MRCAVSWVLYLTATWLNGGLGYNEKFSTTVYGLATGLCYFTPLFGGWLSDRYLGQRKSILIGGFIMVLAQFLLFAPELFTTISPTLTPEQLEHNQFIGRVGLFSGLFLLIIGNGFFKPNISSIVGDLYEPGDKRLDSAFATKAKSVPNGIEAACTFITGTPAFHFTDRNLKQ